MKIGHDNTAAQYKNRQYLSKNAQNKIYLQRDIIWYCRYSYQRHPAVERYFSFSAA